MSDLRVTLQELARRASRVDIVRKDTDYTMDRGVRQRYTIELEVSGEEFSPARPGPLPVDEFGNFISDKTILNAAGIPMTVANEEPSRRLRSNIETILDDFCSMERKIESKDREIKRLDKALDGVKKSREVLEEIDKIVMAVSKKDNTPLRGALRVSLREWAQALLDNPNPGVRDYVSRQMKNLEEHLVTTVALMLVRGVESLREIEEEQEDPIIDPRKLF